MNEGLVRLPLQWDRGKGKMEVGILISGVHTENIFLGLKMTKPSRKRKTVVVGCNQMWAQSGVCCFLTLLTCLMELVWIAITKTAVSHQAVSINQREVF